MKNNRRAFWAITFIIITFINLLFSGCQKIERIMMVSTGSTESVSAYTAIIGGKIIDIGEDAISYGHCYSKNPGPSLSNLKTEMGMPADNFNFKSILSGLEPATKYYVRAYIRKDHVITYGKEISFTTLPINPVYKGSFIEKATPYLIEIEFDLQLSNIIPSPSSFTVMVNSEPRIVSKVEIDKNKVLLTLSSGVSGGDHVTLAYLSTVSDPIQTPMGGKVESIPATNVINKVDLLPVIEAAVVENSTPSLLELVFNLPLANIVPDVSAFTVKFNSQIINVNQVSINQNKLILALSVAVISTDILTMTYTKPLENPIQTLSGGEAETITDITVINNVQLASPVYLSSAIESYSPDILEITYDMTLANIVPSTTAFTVRIGSIVRFINSIAISDNKVRLVLSKFVRAGENVTISYSKPAVNPLQSPAGGLAGSFSAKIVSNNVR